MDSLGVIIIGRNEAPRLAACIQSVRAGLAAAGKSLALAEMVYVDSNSTDDSVAIARSLGAKVVELDPHFPFTAARARNAGAQALFAAHPEVELLQFLDGDTELNPGWPGHAAAYLRHHPKVAVACGRRRERHPDATLYNLLADMEWDTPVGNAHEFGGDAMMRASVYLHLGGYESTFIAGEEPEFAARLRKAGHRIARLNHEMTLHDLGMTRFTQWWRRAVRSGHALAQLAHTHGGRPLFFYRRQWRSTLAWGAVIPFAILISAVLLTPWLLFLLPVAYAYLYMRIFRYRLVRGDDGDSAALYAAFTVLGKFPQLAGMTRFYMNLWRGRTTRLIEYKQPPARAADSGPVNPPATAMGST